MILEFMASEIGVKTGKMILHSKNCHIYKRQYKLMEDMFKVQEDSRRMVKKSDVPT
jgi:thymidylate synthase